MTIEYILLLTAMLFIGLKGFSSAPAKAFKDSGKYLGARVEKQLATGDGFEPKGSKIEWSGDR